MKKIYDIVSMAILLFCTAACSDSYLELSPESSVSDEVIFENADAAQYAVNGLGRIMSTQYLDTQGYNGEGTVYAYQGEYPGDVIQKGSYTGWQNLAKGNYFTSSTNSNIHVTWYYYYKLIRNANQILDNCKTGLANVAEQRKWDYIKAQALVYRAYSYTMLSQLYSRRWTDADGLQRGLVLRTTVNNDEMPCSTMAETFELIYHDLDEAISLFTSCGYDRPVDVDKRWMANLDVAHAVYSRAALIRNDWQTVITHSQEARRNYSIMTPDEYKAGFNTANQEWIWEVFEDDTQPVHYYSFYNYMSASCLGSASRTYPPCISKQIVDPIDPADKRLAIYAIPTPEEVEATQSRRYAGNQIQPQKTVAVLKGRRWVADYEDGLQKIYYKENIIATIYAMADWFSPADIEAPTLEYVCFHNRKDYKLMKISEIPPVIFSEVMRDVDLAVSVAHAGSVDPETSHSTIEMRSVLVELTMPLFHFKNVTIKGSFAHIEGKLGKYNIHLGSGVIHQEGGAQIAVLPVHSQNRGRLFLPFVDEDPKTAEILTKIIFFAEDDKIKDPSILNQIK